MNAISTPDEPFDPLVAYEIDARGLACPMPLLKAKLGLNRLSSGQCLRVLATDAGSVRDFHAFSEISGHRLVHFKQGDGEYEYVLQKIERPDS